MQSSSCMEAPGHAYDAPGSGARQSWRDNECRGEGVCPPARLRRRDNIDGELARRQETHCIDKGWTRIAAFTSSSAAPHFHPVQTHRA